MTETILPDVTTEAWADVVAVPLLTDPIAQGGGHIEVPLRDVPAADPQWWTALFLAFLHRYTSGEVFHLVKSVPPGGYEVQRFAVTGDLTLAELAEQVETAPTARGETLDRSPVVAGLPAAAAAYDDIVDIHLAVSGRTVSLRASGKLWAAETVARMASHIELMAAVPDRRTRISDLPLLTADERALMLTEWNATARDWPESDYLKLLDRQARMHPADPALVFGSAVTTFGQLDSAANRIAQRLRKLGAVPGERVALLCPRSADYVIAAIGVLKTGAAIVPLDPANPDDRLAQMLADAAPIAVITVDALRYRAPDNLPVFRVNGPEFRGEPDEPVPVEITGNTISHLIYTSGSTGKPKAVLERHAALANLVYWTERAFTVGQGDRATWLSAPGFAVQVMEWMPYLALGAAIHIGDMRDPTPDQVRDWLVAQKVTHTLLVSAMAERVWQLEWPAETPLRFMVATAEKVNSWAPAGLPFKGVVTYGSTETTNVLTCYDMGTGVDLTSDATAPEVRATRPVPAGRPVANMRVYLLDPQGNPVPVGVVGRLHVAGQGMSAGYHNQPETTRSKFGVNTLPEEPGDMLYDTGDLARFRADGAIEVLGRSGTQVNVRGFRVELGEVEAALRAMPGIDEAVVVTFEPRPGEVVLVAHVASLQELDSAAVRTFVSGKLPHYMVPGLVGVVDKLPRLPNGKIDRRGLPSPETLRPDSVAYTEPADPVENELSHIWATLLQRDRVGVTDHFFELGGHSLLGFRLIAAIRDKFAVNLSQAELWDNPTIRALGELIALRQNGNPAR